MFFLLTPCDDTLPFALISIRVVFSDERSGSGPVLRDRIGRGDRGGSSERESPDGGRRHTRQGCRAKEAAGQRQRLRLVPRPLPRHRLLLRSTETPVQSALIQRKHL